METLNLNFRTMPHWRTGPMPWPPIARPFNDPGFVLSAGMMSGLRSPYRKNALSAPAWASLSNEKEAYPNGDALTDLGIDPFSILDDVLLLTATPIPARAAATLPADMPRQYLSGSFNTYPFSQTYGYFEVTAKVPSGPGLWPAFWLLPIDQSWPPEIDITEILGDDVRTAYFSIHSGDRSWVASQPDSYNGSTTTEKTGRTIDLSTDYHRYGLDWTTRTITFYIDGVAVGSRPTPADMRKPFYLIVNLAVGGLGSWPGPPTVRTQFPACLAIRSIGIWTRNPNASR
ncbi:glycoside hydrolase family 16 protein [Lichenicola sp.]|uniref:glycoside hydrolase family 16 protein n=1 Tax=Lichenicola sp. TaxID=2804529 RepID=UPI003B00BF8D